MEQFIAESMAGEEVEAYCIGGERFQGRVDKVEGGILTLEWAEKRTYIACDKIVAIWRREPGEQSHTPNLGFVR